MNDVVRSIGQAVDSLYRSFVLRDLLGFVAPGAISLLSIVYMVTRPHSGGFLHWLPLEAERWTSTAPRLILFLGASYLTAWILQGVHYGLLDWLFQFRRSQQEGRHRFWPLTGIHYYARDIGHRPEDGSSISESPSFVTRGALASDAALVKLGEDKENAGVVAILSYSERLMVLVVMTANLTIAGLLFLVAWLVDSFAPWKLTFLGVLLLLYLEHWRLWYARHLQLSNLLAVLQESTGAERSNP